MSLFIQQLLNGISNSSVLFLTSIGLVIIFGMMDVVNNAHGEFIMIGAYITCFSVNVLHLPFACAVILAAIVSALTGIIIERLFIKKLYGKVAETLLVTFALEYVIQQIIRMIFGPENKTMEVPLKGQLVMSNVSIPYYNILLIIMALVVLALTLLLFYKTFPAATQSELCEPAGQNCPLCRRVRIFCISSGKGAVNSIFSSVRGCTNESTLE